MANKTENAFERILSRLEESDEGIQQKVASAADEPEAETRLLDTVRRVSAASTTKTASEATPSADLQRMAKHAQALEEQALIKEAHLLGSAVADGFMERFAQYDSALTSAGVKTASADPALIQAAAQDGFRQGVAAMEKQASDEYEKGYADTLRGIHKFAAEIHYGGQAMASSVIEQLKG